MKEIKRLIKKAQTMIKQTVMLLPVVTISIGLTPKSGMESTYQMIEQKPYIYPLKQEFDKANIEEILKHEIIKLDPHNAARNLNYFEIVHNESKKYGIDPVLFSLMIEQESHWNPRARSKKGAYGLSQITPLAAKEVGINRKNIRNPETNISAGIRYFKRLLDRYNGDFKKSVAAYNAGPDAVDRYKGVPPYKETKNYVKKIMTKYNNLMKKYNDKYGFN